MGASVPPFFLLISNTAKNMKIKITQAGWAGYNGHLGSVEFADGVSVDDVSRGDAAFLAGIVSIEDVKTGENPSDTQRILNEYGNQARVETVVAPTAPAKPELTHSKESLEAVADSSGIKGVREIADSFNVKGNSIAELIEKTLQAQAALAEAK